MSIEDIVRAWKADEEALEPSPVGRELTTQELLEVTGGCSPVGNLSTFTPYCGNDMCTSSPCRITGDTGG